jgi:hypothetical protein
MEKWVIFRTLALTLLTYHFLFFVKHVCLSFHAAAYFRRSACPVTLFVAECHDPHTFPVGLLGADIYTTLVLCR